MRIMFILLDILMLLAFVVGGAGLALAALLDKSRRTTYLRRVLRFLGGCGICYGGFAFLFPLMAALGAAPFLSTREWPTGYACGVVRDSVGRYIVPKPHVNRVQVYDAQRRYLRGWFLPSSSQLIALHLLDGDQIEVFAKQGKSLVYSEDGVLLATGRHNTDRYNVAMQSAHTECVRIPTPLLLWPLSNPFIGWAVAATGLLSVGLAERGLRPRRRVKVIPE